MNNYNNNNNTNNITPPIGNTNQHHHHHPHQYHIHSNQPKYQYTYPEQLRLIDPNQALNDNNNNKKRINFHHTMSAMATPILSASSAGSYLTSNTIGNKDLNKTFLEKY